MAGYVILTCKYHKEDRSWVGVCEELGTSMFGRTLDKVEERLKEAMVLHLNSLDSVGERKRFFEENNIPFYTSMPSKTTVSVETDSDYFVRSCVQPVGELVPV